MVSIRICALTKKETQKVEAQDYLSTEFYGISGNTTDFSIDHPTFTH